MKKLVFMFVAFAAISFASCSCGNKTSDNAATTDSDSVATVDSNASDSLSSDSAATADSTANAWEPEA